MAEWATHPLSMTTPAWREGSKLVHPYNPELGVGFVRRVEGRYLVVYFPAVERDFSFVFDDRVAFERIRASISGLAIPELRVFTPAEIFRGDKVGAEKYSILLRAMFQSGERTLREDEVANWSAQITKALEALGGVQRI